MRIEKLSTSGPAVAALLQESALSKSPFDGLLIGTYTTRTERIHHDTAEETKRQSLEAHISSFCCSQNLGSFYNGAGEIDGEEIATVAKGLQGSCLGWFVHQQAPRRPASARERAVTAALAGCVPHGMPVIFCLMSTSVEPDLSTWSFQQQFHEQAPGSLFLRPIEVCIDNIASCKKQRDYRPLRPIADFAKVSARDQDDPPSNPPPDKSLGDLALQSLSSQAKAMEEVYSTMLRQMDDLSDLARVEEGDLKALQTEVDDLLSALG